MIPPLELLELRLELDSDELLLDELLGLDQLELDRLELDSEELLILELLFELLLILELDRELEDRLKLLLLSLDSELELRLELDRELELKLELDSEDYDTQAPCDSSGPGSAPYSNPRDTLHPVVGGTPSISSATYSTRSLCDLMYQNPAE